MVMLKYALFSVGIIAALLIVGRMRFGASDLMLPQERSHQDASATPESPATTPAAVPDASEAPAGAGGKIQLPLIAKKEFAAPVVLPQKIISQIAPVPPASAASSSVSTTSGVRAPSAATLPPQPPLPPLDEKAIFSAVVKIECPSEDRKGKYVGAGFAMPHGVIMTAAHLIKDSGSDVCQVIFPRDRAPSVYLSGRTEDRNQVRKRHDEQGIDVAFVFMPLLAGYPEAHAVFPDAYPFIPYPICTSPTLLGDTILHFGYPSSFQNNSYLDASEGKAAAYADINGITEELSEDQTYTFKSPVFGYTRDQSQMHPYLISRSPSFYGDSGGLGFDATRQCIVGPDRGGTIGGGAGENFSVFMVLGWEGARAILP